MKRYEGVTAFVLAAYNAGAEAVDRWIVLFHQRRGDGAPFDMEEFIEEIPYAETLHYVRAILGRYWSAK
ncbi:MAG: hypothetical protein HYV03_08580 [Deltaproteobacteria bacterium]|nr:hypothetical protein [Deltaproteobacteria bacterium]